MKYLAHLVVLWSLLLPLLGSLMSYLGVLNYLIAILAGWVLATITLPIILYYIFTIYLGQNITECVFTTVTAHSLDLPQQRLNLQRCSQLLIILIFKSSPLAPAVQFECRADVQMAGRVRKRVNALVAIKDTTLYWKPSNGGATSTISLVGCVVKNVPKGLLRCILPHKGRSTQRSRERNRNLTSRQTSAEQGQLHVLAVSKREGHPKLLRCFVCHYPTLRC